jgi:4-hydroxybenzoate polyprenyltransferase
MAPVLGLAVALIVLGLIGLVAFPWGGFVLIPVGLILLVAYLVGFGKRAANPR